ncbi:protein tramtrack, beta isoform isoform X2 [Halyomorpha halys]|uniref:protein tramtrack, beta isoform isoform X2 n=1 Tax=Halyomorpha halys TaxID=286706 RepID=UPI0006D4FB12|nr:protein tramtrack, beta isoform isoform X2 [Halyomorpha halys]
MGSQRFCLRWNNHQTNLLSVFDQLLHDEAFVDVTLAVEGQFLRAHKMVLSACSPYFQALFVGHPDKHPIVILKDVPYSDMRSLLDFMYRGEVSVDQDRLTAFLKVAESLRIKGLTEVNEERCDLPSIANSLLNQTLPPPPPPPSLHRLSMPPNAQPKRPPPPNPMLNSALTAPKRKRGRPRKLSGSSPNPPHLPHPDVDHEDQKPQTAPVMENHLGVGPPFPPMPLQQQHPQQTNSLTMPEMAVGNYRSCLGPVVAPQGIPQSCNNPPHQTSNLPHTVPTEDPESPKIEDEEEEDCEEVHKIEDGEEEGCMEEDEPPDPQHLKTEEPKPSTSGQDSLASFQSSTQSDGERFSSSGLKVEPNSDFIEMDEEETSNIMTSFDDLIACSPASSDIEENVEAEFSSQIIEPEFADDDISQFEEDSLRSLIGRLSDSDGNRRRMDKMSIRKFCSREGDQVHRCTICSKAYTHISNFCRHFLSAHCGNKQEVHCPICNKPFTRKDNMMTHAKQVHGLSCMRGSISEQLPNYDQQTE